TNSRVLQVSAYSGAQDLAHGFVDTAHPFIGHGRHRKKLLPPTPFDYTQPHPFPQSADGLLQILERDEAALDPDSIRKASVQVTLQPIGVALQLVHGSAHEAGCQGRTLPEILMIDFGDG